MHARAQRTHAIAHVRSAAERTRTRHSEEPSPGADVGGASPVPVQMWAGRVQSRCRCGRVPVQMWAGRAQSRCRCGRASDTYAST
jgi:hypothetical protein